MKLVKTTLLVALIGGLGACASHQTESDFGNSVKKMIAEQTANPDAQHESIEQGDGQRLERVVEDYRGNVSERKEVNTQVRLGI